MIGMKKRFLRIIQLAISNYKNLLESSINAIRISETRIKNGKTYCILQLVGRNTHSKWLAVSELINDENYFPALSQQEKDFLLHTYYNEEKSFIGNKNSIFFISSIDFEDGDYLISIRSQNGSFQKKFFPTDIVNNKELFENVSLSDRERLKKIIDLKKQNDKIIFFPNKIQ